MKKLLLVALVLALSSGEVHPQSRSGQVVHRYTRPIRTVALDLATGTVTRRPALRQRSATTVSDFPNASLSGFIGTPEQVTEQIQRLQKQAPIAELALVTNFGGLPHWQVVKTQDLFARHVLPAFRRSE